MAVATADALTKGGYKVRTSKDASSGSSSLAFFDTFLVDVKVLSLLLTLPFLALDPPVPCSRPSFSLLSTLPFLALDPTLLRSRLLNASPKHTRMISSSSLSSLLLFFFLGGCEECRWFQSYPSRGG